MTQIREIQKLRESQIIIFISHHLCSKTALATPVVEAGFCPVINLSSTTTCDCQLPA